MCDFCKSKCSTNMRDLKETLYRQSNVKIKTCSMIIWDQIHLPHKSTFRTWKYHTIPSAMFDQLKYAFVWVNIKQITVLYFPYSTVCHIRNISELLKVTKMNNLSTRNAFTAICNKITLWNGPQAQYSTLLHYHPHPHAIFFHIVFAAVL